MSSDKTRSLARCYQRLASLYYKQGENSKAEPLMAQVQTILEPCLSSGRSRIEVAEKSVKRLKHAKRNGLKRFQAQDL